MFLHADLNLALTSVNSFDFVANSSLLLQSRETSSQLGLCLCDKYGYILLPKINTVSHSFICITALTLKETLAAVWTLM